MYFRNTNSVNARVVGAGRRWLLLLATLDGLRQFGPIFISLEAAHAAVDGR